MVNVKRIIALEEAFITPEIRSLYPPDLARLRDKVSKGLLGDVGEARLARMDAAGIDVQVLSLVSPGVQTFAASDSIRLAKSTNDWLAEVCQRWPTRFAGFACLPTPDPRAAADELERSVRALGLKGALINGHTHGHYLDEEKFWVILERAEALDVPIYIHPADLPQAVVDTYFKPYPALAGAAWGWAVDTGTHLLRLMASGAFDTFPRLKIIVGHMGELIPFHLRRIQRGMSLGAAMAAPTRMRRGVADYLHDNVFVTTSGVFEHSALLCALTTIGIDNLLFSVDDPFADNQEAVAFLASAPLSQGDRERLAHGNAERLLRI